MDQLSPGEQILKKEDKLTYWAGFLSANKGTLVLTTTRLYFQGHFAKQIAFSVPLPDILSVNCQKGIGTSNENMYVIYKDGDKEKKIKMQHSSFMSLSTVGNLSRIGASYFSSWEQAINDARQGRRGSSGDMNDLVKLAELRKEGVLTEEEFSAKKKQILGI